MASEAYVQAVHLVQAELRAELGLLSLKQLRERALAAGVGEDAVEEARDADRPKAALISLLVQRAQRHVEAGGSAAAMPHAEAGSAAHLLLAIRAGGETAVGVLVPVLEHASDLLSGRQAKHKIDAVESAKRKEKCAFVGAAPPVCLKSPACESSRAASSLPSLSRHEALSRVTLSPRHTRLLALPRGALRLSVSSC